MPSKLFSIFIFLLLFSVLACKNATDSSPPEKIIDPILAALPHGDTLPANKLSTEEHKTLAKAKGRTVDTINMKNLISMIDSSSNKLHAYVFWKLDCKTCFTQHKFLQRLQNESGTQKLELIFVNLNPLSQLPLVNASIRAQSISQKAYIVSNLNFSELAPKYKKAFASTPPTVLFVNKEYDTFVYYNRMFEYDELFAILQPLLM